jgi:hypothetical protein
MKEAFWAAAEADPSEHARHVAALASVDSELASRLEALLAADASANPSSRSPRPSPGRNRQNVRSASAPTR